MLYSHGFIAIWYQPLGYQHFVECTSFGDVSPSAWAATARELHCAGGCLGSQFAPRCANVSNGLDGQYHKDTGDSGVSVNGGWWMGYAYGTDLGE